MTPRPSWHEGSIDAVAEWGSVDLDDHEFVRRFERCEYPNERFRHADHIRLAWIYVRQCGAKAAEARVVDSLQRFARSLNHPEKYHDTITRSWLRLVAAACAATPNIDDFHRFARAHAWLLDRHALSAFYSERRLATDAARHAWIPPDLRALPGDERALGIDPAAPVRTDS